MEAGASTRDLEVDEGGVELRARFWAVEPAEGVVVEAVEGAAEGAAPAPALHVAEGIEVCPAVLAARDAVAGGAGSRRLAALVGGGEGRHGDAPLDAARVQRLLRHGEAGDRRAHRHGDRDFRLRSGSARWGAEEAKGATCDRRDLTHWA